VEFPRAVVIAELIHFVRDCRLELDVREGIEVLAHRLIVLRFDFMDLH